MLTTNRRAQSTRGARNQSPNIRNIANRLPLIGNINSQASYNTNDESYNITVPANNSQLSNSRMIDSSLFQPQQQSGLAIGACSEQGRRPYQEDEFVIRTNLKPKSSVILPLTQQHLLQQPQMLQSDTHYFGLFDGHAGGKCSKYISQTLPDILSEDNLYVSNLPTALKRSYHVANDQFLKLAEKFNLQDGSTGISAVLRDGKLTVANVGDCRAIIVCSPNSGKSHVVQISIDQKPTMKEEEKRINQLGGVIVNCMGVARVNGVLAVSRAFGNRLLRQVIRPDAEITTRELTRDDEYLVMASDGMWDVLKNKDIADIIYQHHNLHQAHFQQSFLLSQHKNGLNASSSGNNLVIPPINTTKIAEELVHAALVRGSMDNVTCIVIRIKEYIDKIFNEHNLIQLKNNQPSIQVNNQSKNQMTSQLPGQVSSNIADGKASPIIQLDANGCSSGETSRESSDTTDIDLITCTTPSPKNSSLNSFFNVENSGSHANTGSTIGTNNGINHGINSNNGFGSNIVPSPILNPNQRFNSPSPRINLNNNSMNNNGSNYANAHLGQAHMSSDSMETIQMMPNNNSRALFTASDKIKKYDNLVSSMNGNMKTPSNSNLKSFKPIEDDLNVMPGPSGPLSYRLTVPNASLSGRFTLNPGISGINQNALGPTLSQQGQGAFHSSLGQPNSSSSPVINQPSQQNSNPSQLSITRQLSRSSSKRPASVGPGLKLMSRSLGPGFTNPGIPPSTNQNTTNIEPLYASRQTGMTNQSNAFNLASNAGNASNNFHNYQNSLSSNVNSSNMSNNNIDPLLSSSTMNNGIAGELLSTTGSNFSSYRK